LLITFGGIAFGVYDNYGLTIQQWLLSVAIGSIALVVNVFLKLLPIGKLSDDLTSGFGKK
jgi:Ca2+ transporting ATPase